MTSWLFVPGSRPERFDKAAAAGASEVVVDLEDAVGPDAKVGARDAVTDWLARGSAWVRVNAVGTAWHAEDLAAVLGTPGLRGVVLPEAEDADVVGRVAARLRAGVGLVPLVESARGVVAALDLAGVSGVTRLAFGSVDYALDIGAQEEPATLAHPRSVLVVASRVAGIDAPVDGVTTDVRDTDLVAADADRARRLGFGAKLCIHPAQVPVVRAAFAPTAQELAWARGVLAAADDTRPGEAFAHEGRMVDVPVLERARTLLARAGEQR